MNTRLKRFLESCLEEVKGATRSLLQFQKGRGIHRSGEHSRKTMALVSTARRCR